MDWSEIFGQKEGASLREFLLRFFVIFNVRFDKMVQIGIDV